MKTALQAPWLVRDIHSYENRNRCGENTYYRCYMKKDFKLVKVLGPYIDNKKNGIPFLIEDKSNIIRPFKSHHGRYSASVALKQ
jgi:hypothetical protein